MSDISYKSIFRVVLVASILFLLSKILEVILILFVSIILTSAIKPVIKHLDKYKIPKNLATLVIVFGSATLFLVILYLGITPIVKEVSFFVTNFGTFLDQISKNYNIQIPNRDELTNLIKNSFGSFGSIGGQVGNAGGQIFKIGSGLFNAVLSTLVLIALTFYQLSDENKTRDFVASFFGKRSDMVKHIVDRSEKKLGAWLQGQLSLMFFIGAITYVSLFIVGIFYPGIAIFVLPLAVIAGLLEIIPVLGPTLALVPAIFVGAATSPICALVILLLYLGIQQAESSIIIPKVMNQAVGLDPIIVILGILIGNTLIGPIGSLLSVPVMAIFSVLYDEWRDQVV